MELKELGIETVAACQGFVENQLRRDAGTDPRKRLVLDAYLSVSAALDRARNDNFETFMRSATLPGLPTQQANPQMAVSIELEWTDIDVCHANVEQNDDTFTAGAVYLNTNGEPTIETEAFKSVAITLSELKAIVYALETRRRELPTARSEKL